MVNFGRARFFGAGFAVCVLVRLVLCGTPAAAQAGAESRAALIAHSKKYIGTPYRYGGIDLNGMDCSGFLYAAARESIGLQLPRTVDALYGMSRMVDEAHKEPGDILFFRTVGTKISHAGLYLGNGQFIHAASDGPDTGVIISSLKEVYWQRTYAFAGQILPPARGPANADGTDSGTGASIVDNLAGAGAGSSAGANSSAPGTAGSAPSSAASPRSGRSASPANPPNAFVSRLEFDATLTADWTLFSTKRFMLISRGAAFTLHASYGGAQLRPGIGLGIGYDAATGVLNVPLTATLSMDNGIRVYAGPVFSFGSPVLPETPVPVRPSIFPGIIGASWQAPPLKIKAARLSFVQDIHYQVYNAADGAALNFLESLSAGLVFSSGIRLNLAAKDVL